VRNYYQPAFYRFSEDSIILAKFIKDNAGKDLCCALEVGAGCGVISFELIDHGVRFASLACLEIQPEFQESFIQNKKQFGSNQQLDFIQSDFLTWQPPSKFDLIYFNPPYYLRGHGIESKNQNTQMCRSIEVDQFRAWLGKARQLLAPKGQLFFCLNEVAAKKLQRIIDEIFNNRSKQVQMDNCIIYYLTDSE
jgi:tRNA1(Val) A37 N6-methylase TrmN6